jgi:hypothetical protein
VWSASAEEGAEGGTVPIPVSISYPQQVESARDVVYVMPATGGGGGLAFFLVVDTETGAFVTLGGSGTAEQEPYCGTGTATNPQAEPGYICVFESGPPPGTFAQIRPYKFGELAGEEKSQPSWVSPDPQSGVVIPFTIEEDAVLGTPASSGGYAKGSWALNTE